MKYTHSMLQNTPESLPPILFESSNLIVLNKPSGLRVVEDRFRADLPNLRGLLSEAYGTIYVVHRLDAGTSGVIVFAKDEETHRVLSQAFEGREVDKSYLALVKGIPKESSGTINRPIGEHPSKPGVMRIDPDRGKESITEYKVLETFRDLALIEAKPLTGRTHQIRVHLAAIGSPLAIDPLYGSDRPLFLSHYKAFYKPSNHGPERPIMNRLTLHASRLSFNLSGQSYEFLAELPKDFNATVKQFRKL